MREMRDSSTTTASWGVLVHSSVTDVGVHRHSSRSRTMSWGQTTPIAEGINGPGGPGLIDSLGPRTAGSADSAPCSGITVTVTTALLTLPAHGTPRVTWPGRYVPCRHYRAACGRGTRGDDESLHEVIERKRLVWRSSHGVVRGRPLSHGKPAEQSLPSASVLVDPLADLEDQRIHPCRLCEELRRGLRGGRTAGGESALSGLSNGELPAS